MSWITISGLPSGARVHVRGNRIHHGLTGCAMVATGLVLIWHDWKDRPWPLHENGK